MSGASESDSPAAAVPPLPPRLVDPVPLVLTGISLWFLGFLVLLAIDLGSGRPPHGWTWVCLAGVGLGFVGLSIMVWQRRARRRGSRSAQQL